MSTKILFDSTADQEFIAQLTERVPATWSWIDGFLKAPQRLLDTGEAVAHTGIALQRSHIIRPTVVGVYDQATSRARKPDLASILIDRKLPGFINFDEAGYETSVVTFELAQRFAAYFLGIGYRGSLSFYRDCCEPYDSKFSNSALCSIIFKEYAWKMDSQLQDIAITLEWNPRYGGSPKSVAEITELCLSFGLKEHPLTS